MKIIYFVHGTTVDNIENKSAGWNDVELSEKGIEQAISLKEKIDFDNIDIVFSSDLIRAKQTAQIVFGGEKDIVFDSRIRECNYGDLNGKDSNFVNYEEHIVEKFPSGESLKDVEKRVKDFLEFLKNNYKDKNIAIVSHRAPQLAIEVMSKGISWDDAISNDWRKTKNWKPGWDYEI